MRTSSLRTLVIGAAGGALVLAGGIAAVAPAAGLSGIGVDTIPTPTTGVITLATSASGGNGSVTYVGDGSSAPAQTLAVSGGSSSCLLGTPTAATNILGFTGATNPASPVAAPVGFATSTSAGSIGVAAQNGAACSQVNWNRTAAQSEALTITLNTAAIKDSGGVAVPDLLGRTARFDIESKGSVVVRADFYAAGSSPVYTRKLFTGSAQIPTADAAISDKCDKTGKDTGPDSGSGDNCSWSVSPSAGFTKVVLTPLAGASFAVEGGGDYGSAAAGFTTQFSVGSGEGTLDCGSTTPTVTSSDGSTAVTVTRLVNGDGSACVLIPYNLDATSNVCQFTKPLQLQPTAQFLITCVRTIASAATAYGAGPSDYSGGSPFVATPIDPLGVEWPDGSNLLLPLTYCPADLYDTTTSGGVTTASWDYAWLAAHKSDVTAVDLLHPTTYFGTDMSTLSGLQYSCIRNESSTVLDTAAGAAVADGSVRVTDVVYLTGDILLTTKR